MKTILDAMLDTAATGGSVLNPRTRRDQQSQLEGESLLEPEFAPVYQAWKASPTPVNTSAALRAIEPVMQAGLRSYGGHSADSPILRSRAKLLAIDALRRYDPSRSKLRTHLLTNLQGLQRARAGEENIIAMPERMRLARGKLLEASAALADRLGREPSDDELQQKTGIPIKHIEKIRRSSRVAAESQLVSGEDEDGEYFSPAVSGRDDDNTWLRFVYGDLDPYDKVILERVAGLHGKERKPKSQIAAMLGISPSAVSQRLARIQQLLDTRDTVNNLL